MPLDASALRSRLQEALGEEYKVLDLLGEGGYAAVFRAREVAQRREVAVKVLDLGLTPSAELAERFVREARTVARLEHPHIVPIYRVGGYKKTVLYIVMRCVDGPSLRHLLERRRRMSVDDAVRVARQVADALGYAHRQRVVHRDIKPDNILLDSGGHVLVTDFGIAKASEAASASQLTTEGMVVGTPHYMSPEQATGDRIDTRSDIYSLGVVLYQMLAGVLPFDGDSAQAILMKQATATPDPVRDHRREVPPPLADALERMLAKDPADRFQTAEAVSQALLAARPAAAEDRVGGSGRRVAGLMGPVVVVALLAAGFLGWGSPARIRVTDPVPDSLNQRLRERGILGRRDTAVFAFSPAPADAPLFVVARHRVAVAAPHHLRGYPREGTAYQFGSRWGLGPRFVFILVSARGERDTVFASLSPRAAWALGRGVEKLLADAAHRSALRVDRP